MEETTQVTSSRKKPSRVIDSYAAKCRKCNKWRLLDSQEEYEEITSKSLNKSFECNNCEEPEVDYSYNWSTVCILGGSHPLILIRDIKSSSDVLQSNNDAIPSKKKRKTRNVQENLAESKTSVLIDLDEGEEKHMSESLQNEKQATNKGIESSSHALPSQNCDATPSKKKRKRDRKEEATESKKQAINHEKNIENEAITNKLIIEEIEKGQPDGKIAVNGKKVSIIYTGKLKDTNKVFETNLGEAPYRFRLGGENVMKGLSNGVEGMRVGEKRRLIIPPGYLEEGLKEAVPKNAWLLKWRLLKSDDAIGFDRLIQA